MWGSFYREILIIGIILFLANIKYFIRLFGQIMKVVILLFMSLFFYSLLLSKILDLWIIVVKIYIFIYFHKYGQNI